MMSAPLNCFQWQVNVFPAQMISLKFFYLPKLDQILRQINASPNISCQFKKFLGFFHKDGQKI